MPAPKPTQLKVLEGNRGRRPLPKGEPKPRPVAPEMPEDIDEGAREVWKRLAPKLERLGLLTDTDGDAFAHLCQIRGRLATIQRFIRDNNPSLVQETKKGLRPSPYVVMEKQYYDLFRKHAADFGLTPRGRVGLSVGTDKGEEGADLLDQ